MLTGEPYRERSKSKLLPLLLLSFFTHKHFHLSLPPSVSWVFREKTVKQGAAGVEPVVCCNNKCTMAHLTNPTYPLTKKPQQSCKVVWYE